MVGARLFSWIDLSFEDSGRIDWTKINVAKSKFSMLKSIEMRHPEHPSCKSTATSSRGNRISKSPSPWKKTRNLLVSNFFEAKQGAQKTYKVKMNSSLFIEVFNKSARVGAMEKTRPPLWGQEFGNRSQRVVPSTRFWSALWRRRMWNHCRDIFSIPLRSLGDVVGSLPRQSLPLMAQSKETRHRLKLVWKDSVVFWKSEVWMLAEIHQKVCLPLKNLSEWRANQIEVSWRSWPSKKSPRKPPSLDTNSCEHCTHQTK